MSVTDLASQLPTIEQAVLGFSPQHFGPLGVEIVQVQGLSINLPDEVQKAVDTRSTMGVLGVNYMQYQAGQAMTTAAANPSGGAGALASAGVGLGAGLGHRLRDERARCRGHVPGGGPASPCPKCNALVPAGTGSVRRAAPPSAPAALRRPSRARSAAADARRTRSSARAAALRWRPRAPRTCPKCNANVTGAGKFCPNCGAPLGP